MGMRLSNRQHKYSNILTYDTIMLYYTFSLTLYYITK